MHPQRDVSEIFFLAPYSPYFPHLNDYIRLSKEKPDQYLTVCYEDMKENPFREIEKIAKFLDVTVDEEEVFEDLGFFLQEEKIVRQGTENSQISPMFHLWGKRSCGWGCGL